MQFVELDDIGGVSMESTGVGLEVNASAVRAGPWRMPGVPDSVGTSEERLGGLRFENKTDRVETRMRVDDIQVYRPG